MSEEDTAVTQRCECGNDTYHIKMDDAREQAWAECSECGRPTAVFGHGIEKQREWYDDE